MNLFDRLRSKLGVPAAPATPPPAEKPAEPPPAPEPPAESAGPAPVSMEVPLPEAAPAPVQDPGPTRLAAPAPEPLPAGNDPEPEPEPEPTLETVVPETARRDGAHVDAAPTSEFRLPTLPAVLPLRQRPAGGDGRPEVCPPSPMQKLTKSRDRWLKPEPRKGPATNILVVDRSQTSCWLVKSILLGQRFGVSIATSLEEASTKMATGLFDVAFVDVGDGSGPEREFLASLQVEMPAVPLVVVQRPEAKEAESLPAAIRIVKPIRVAKVQDAGRLAASLVEKASLEARIRTAVRLPVRVQDPEGASIPCLLTNVSLSGLMLEPEGTGLDDARAFQQFFGPADKRPVTVDLVVDGRPAMQVTARRAFAEETPDHRIRQVGLAIWLVDEEKASLKELIAQVA